jgi:hypothetical protein
LGSWREISWSDMSRGGDSSELRSDGEAQARAFWRQWQALVGGPGAAGTTSSTTSMTGEGQ